MDASLTERKQLREASERQQADEIGFRIAGTPFPDLEEGDDFAVYPGDPVHMAVVSNESRRPIKNVRCRIGSDSGIHDLFSDTRSESEYAVLARPVRAPDTTGSQASDTVIHPSPPRSWLRIRPGETYGFVFEINVHRGLELVPVIAVRFTDNAGLHWQIDRDQHLTRLPHRDDW